MKKVDQYRNDSSPFPNTIEMIAPSPPTPDWTAMVIPALVHKNDGSQVSPIKPIFIRSLVEVNQAIL